MNEATPHSNRGPLMVGALALIVTVGAALAFALGVRSSDGPSAPPAAIADGLPTAFERDFRGTGLVERIEHWRGGSCTVTVALYEWISLGPGFALHEIPQQSQRFHLHGDGRACQAVTVAMAATSQHIAFEAGRAGQEWYLAEPPAPALGCGGLLIDWEPDPA